MTSECTLFDLETSWSSGGFKYNRSSLLKFITTTLIDLWYIWWFDKGNDFSNFPGRFIFYFKLGYYFRLRKKESQGWVQKVSSQNILVLLRTET